ncbi:hypothetical protein HOV32_gp19 [Klebsiella phage Pharr]|uniref:Uncharacterized protein n=1 Tax=Klebsiella phage Pharr TaxID=2562178 RepID=A0A4D6DXZ8_9CAUD|nr:hypothetical protein HOV32_gp19 [Klebsiella phage Pharr]QBZ71227.1 hypothetical protein CPT_Pharr_019 [Klebsiella phage Pharr]
MFKLIETLGRLVIALYIREAKALDKASKVEAKAAAKLAKAADKALDKASKVEAKAAAKLAKAADKARQASLDATAEAAKVAAKAQKLKEFF